MGAPSSSGFRDGRSESKIPEFGAQWIGGKTKSAKQGSGSGSKGKKKRAGGVRKKPRSDQYESAGVRSIARGEANRKIWRGNAATSEEARY